MPVRAVDDKPSDTLVVVSGEGFWTGSSTLPHLHQLDPGDEARLVMTAGLRDSRAGRSAPAELGSHVLQDRLDRVGVVRDAELIRNGQEQRVRGLDRRVLGQLPHENIRLGGV